MEPRRCDLASGVEGLCCGFLERLMSESIVRVFVVGAGGAAGSILRYVIGGLVQRTVIAFPLGTLVVSVLGCLAIGFLSERLTEASVDSLYRTGILIGVLGGFTTFSTFSLETLKLAEDRQFALALLNVAASVATCLIAAWAGAKFARWMVTP